MVVVVVVVVVVVALVMMVMVHVVVHSMQMMVVRHVVMVVVVHVLCVALRLNTALGIGIHNWNSFASLAGRRRGSIRPLPPRGWGLRRLWSYGRGRIRRGH